MLSSGGSAQTGLSFRAIIQTMEGRLSFRYVQDARRTDAAVAERPDLALTGRLESTYCGRSRARSWTPQLGEYRPYRRRREKARFPLDSRHSIARAK
jgi:hypothetical protein